MYTTQGYFIEIEEYKNVSPLKEMPIIKSNEENSSGSNGSDSNEIYRSHSSSFLENC